MERAEAQDNTRMIGGRYEVIDEIGRGGMGVVWQAWDEVLGREVAIKELRLPEGLPDAERRVYEERVLREARTAGRLNDPAVVTVYDVLAEGDSTLIVMELVRAVTLSDLVTENGPLPTEQVIGIARQVLSALESAHESDVVHRDVKPSNIMVADGKVKLTDFGIAQALDAPKLTTSGVLVGSPSFMAPERLQGADASPSSDMWSLGATLFYAVEGWVPFERKTTAATLQAVLNEPPKMSKSHGGLTAVILGLLITDPESRFGPSQVRTLLDGSNAATPAVASTTSEPEPVSTADTSMSLDQRHLIAACAVGVLLFCLGLLVGALFL